MLARIDELEALVNNFHNVLTEQTSKYEFREKTHFDVIDSLNTKIDNIACENDALRDQLYENDIDVIE